MSFIGLLRTLEQITRPPRMGHDVDVEDGAAQLAEREAETECLVPEDFNAVCRCEACVAEEQASAVEYDEDPSPTIVQSAPPPTVDGEGPASVRDIQPSPEAGRPTSELLTEAARIIGNLSQYTVEYFYSDLMHELCERAATFKAIED